MIYCRVNRIKCREDQKIKQIQQNHEKENINQDRPLMQEKEGKNKNTPALLHYNTLPQFAPVPKY